jgi:hypothetical protein
MARQWVTMLDATHVRGELLVINLHPERFALCRPALVALLEAARAKNVWCARLDEIARGWRAGRLTRGHWHGGARSALCITGDIDALTLGDYALRIVGR